MKKLPELDSLEIEEGGQGICGSIGYITLKNISVLEKLNLKKLNIVFFDTVYTEKNDFWDYMNTTSIKEITFSGIYDCEPIPENNKIKKISFLAQNKTTKFTCDGVIMKKLWTKEIYKKSH